MDSRFESDLHILKESLKCLQRDDGGYYLTSSFLDGLNNLHFSLTRISNKNLRNTYNAMSNINQDLWNICSLAYRMEWFRTYMKKLELTGGSSFIWGLFTGLDIEHFFVEVRSILDYTAVALGGLLNKPGQIPESFDKLYNRLENRPHIYENMLDSEIIGIIKSASWYSDIRQIRNNIVHFGSSAFVFSSPNDGILFQIFHNGWEKSIIMEPLMWNANVVDFQLYAALYFSKTLSLLGQLGDLISTRVPKPYGISNAKANFSGIEIFAEWIRRLIKKLEI